MKHKFIKKFGTRSPKWPQIGFVVIAFFAYKKDRETATIFPLRNFYTRMESIDRGLSELIKAATFKKTHLRVREQVLLTPLLFKEEVALKPEYWEEPLVKFDFVIRGRLFTDYLLQQGKYVFLVTPDAKNGNKETFGVPMPVKRDNSLQEIEMFMQKSDWVVDPTARSAAVYTANEPLVYDLKSGKMYMTGKSEEEEENEARRVN